MSDDDIIITLRDKEISSGQEIHGNILLNYNDRFDSLVINSLIENSNDTASIEIINKKRINHPYPRLSMLRSDIGDSKVIEFVAKANHVPKEGSSNVKFRASIIQEHKEIASSVKYLKILK
ncbi:MAG: hypothetical protein WBP64_12275 [Nitrososphaeraceae archaeon]